MPILAMSPPRIRRAWKADDLMRDELSHALHEALFELEVLPRTPEGAMVGLYAIMDDLRSAIMRTERLDPHLPA